MPNDLVSQDSVTPRIVLPAHLAESSSHFVCPWAFVRRPWILSRRRELELLLFAPVAFDRKAIDLVEDGRKGTILSTECTPALELKSEKLLKVIVVGCNDW